MTPFPPFAYNLLAFLLIALFAWRGWKRGLIRELSGMLSIVASTVLAKPLGWVLLRFGVFEGVPSLLRSPSAFLLGGLLSYPLLRVALSVIARVSGLLRDFQGRARRVIQGGGAVVGGAFGALLVLSMGWYLLTIGNIAAISLRKLPTSTGQSGLIAWLFLPTKLSAVHQEAFAQSFTGFLAEKTNPIPADIQRGIDVIALILEEPERLKRLAKIAPLVELVRHASVQELARSEEIRLLVEQGDVMGLLNHPLLTRVLEDSSARAALRKVSIEEVLHTLEQEEAPR